MPPIRPPLCTSSSIILPKSVQFLPRIPTASLHHSTPRAPVPPPTPFCPDPSTFLTLIGRSLSQHSSKIPTWESLFSLSSTQLRDLGVEPARARRYLLWWRERFRKGLFGVGGDMREVENGVAELRIVEVGVGTRMLGVVQRRGDDGNGEGNGSGLLGAATVNRSPGMKKVIVNVKPGTEVDVELLESEGVRQPSGIGMKEGHTIVGPHVEFVKGEGGSVARVKVKEGLWEQKRGKKVDGGERRRAEVRAKRRSQERKDR